MLIEQFNEDWRHWRARTFRMYRLENYLEDTGAK